MNRGRFAFVGGARHSRADCRGEGGKGRRRGRNGSEVLLGTWVWGERDNGLSTHSFPSPNACRVSAETQSPVPGDRAAVSPRASE